MRRENLYRWLAWLILLCVLIDADRAWWLVLGLCLGLLVSDRKQMKRRARTRRRPTIVLKIDLPR
jgi:hypothetical protein